MPEKKAPENTVKLQVPSDCTQSLARRRQLPESSLQASARKPKPGWRLWSADHFVEKYAAAHGKDVRRIATTAIDMLMSYHWPGNVRELENCLERAVLVCDGHVIHAHHLPPTLQTAEASGTVTRVSLKDAVAAYEKDLIQDALKTTRGNRAKAARLLNTTERIINYQVRKYNIDYARFKS